MKYDLITSGNRILHSKSLNWYIDKKGYKVDNTFLSHRHADHYEDYHQLYHCSKETGDLFCTLKKIISNKIKNYDFNHEYKKNGITFRLLHAGHILGSAQLQIKTPSHTCLYSGDICLKESFTCPEIEIKEADLLVIAATYGHPYYTFQSRKESINQIKNFIFKCKKMDYFPVFVTTSVTGKAQEIIYILYHNFQLRGSATEYIHNKIRSYRKYVDGFPLVDLWDVNENFKGDYLIIQTHLMQKVLRESTKKNQNEQQPLDNYFTKENIPRKISKDKKPLFAYVSGWAKTKKGLFAEFIEYSDHADYNDLLKFIKRVNPTEIWTFDDKNESHGFFAHHLKEEFDYETVCID